MPMKPCRRRKQSAFSNGIYPGLAVKLGPGIDNIDVNTSEREATPLLQDWQRQQLETVFRKLFQGAGKAGSVVFLDALIKSIEPITNKPDEMAFAESGTITRSRIMQAFGVNPIVLGEIENANKASSLTAENLFCLNCVNPLMTLVSEVLTAKVAPKFGENLIVWLDPARARDEELTLQTWETGLRWAMVTRDEFRSHVLALPPMPGGDVVVTPLNAELLAVGQLPDESNYEGDELDEEASGADKALKKKRRTSKSSRPPG